ncbi:MAG TPA: exodeoxyribonuclease V subunit gamma [Xanthomonadaceae bacterium]|nr:exodeoxyribonuclease V subunit gamma [Xanthomonadaceae bacterium]
MPLHLTYSNRLERVAAAMAAAMAAEPLSDPLQGEMVLVPHSGVGRWMQMHFAQAWGVAANIRFGLVGDLIAATLARAGRAGGAAWTEDALELRVLEQLQAGAQVGIGGARTPADANGRDAFALARSIARRFDAYQVLRPEWIAAWNGGRDDLPELPHTRWQAALWRRLVAAAGGGDRASLLHRLLQQMDAGPLTPGVLPVRLWAVLPSSTSPWHLQFLALAAQHIPVRLFRLVPSQVYWGDERSWRELARRRRDRPDPDEVPASASGQLLASLARPMRAAIDQDLSILHDRAERIDEDFQAPAGRGLLHAVQHALLALSDPPTAPARVPDPSLRVHVCHDRRREVEVLHDALLGLFERLPGLEPSDIAIMAPRIEDYSGLVSAVFDAAPRERRIPVGQGERSAAGTDTLAARMDWLLEIDHARWSAGEILALLKLPAVQRRFGIDADALPALHRWMDDTAVHWGLDAAHRAREGAGAAADNTWRAALARWWLGYVHGEAPFALVGEVAPYAQSAAASEAVAGLEALLDALEQWRRDSLRPRSPQEWARALDALLAQFFDPAAAELESVERMQHAVDALAETAARAGAQPVIGLEVVRGLFAERMAEQVRGRGFLAEGATVCSLVPMRSVPFRVICVLGLDDGVFPRRSVAPGFDLMRAAPRPGDRDVRDEDRQLLLETVLSAREHLHLSYVGFDARDGSLRPPAPPLAELMDFAGLAEDADGKRPPTVIEHRLAPYHPDYFRRDGAAPSYAREWVQPPAIPPAVDATGSEAAAQSEAIDAGELLAFVASPPRWFVRERLGLRAVRASGMDEDIAETHDAAAVRERVLRIVEGLFLGLEPPRIRRSLRAEALLQSGALGQVQWRTAWSRGEQLHAAVLARGGVPRRVQHPVDLQIGPHRVRGEVTVHECAGSAVAISGSGIGSWDLIGLGAVASLCGLAPGCAFGIKDGKVQMRAVGAAVAGAQWLADVLALREEMLQAPQPVWPRAGWAYVERLADGRDEAEALARARSQWEGSDGHSRGEHAAFEPALLAGAIAGDPLGPAFCEHARRLWLPLAQAVEKVRP